MGRNRRAKAEPSPAGAARGNTMPTAQPALTSLLAGAVTALFVLRPLYPSESVAAEGDGLPVVMLWLLALIAWAILLARGNLSRVRFGWPDLAVALLVLWHSLSALWAVAFERPRPALNMLWEWIGLGIAFLLARQVFSSARERRAIGAVMVALAVVVSVYGLYQYSVELPTARALYKQSPDKVLRDAGLWFPPGSPGREAYEQRLASLEPMATFALTNSLAGFLAPWAMVILGASFLAAKRLGGLQRSVIALLLIPLGLCLLLTKSRSAYLACLCGAGGIAAIAFGGRWAVLRSRRSLLIAGSALVLIIGAIVGTVTVGGLDAEVLSEAPKSLGYRLQYWQASTAMIRDMPIFGCGPGNFQDTYTAYKLPEASEEICDPHNFLIEIWATAGTPALLALVVAGVASCFCIFRIPQKEDDRPCGSNGDEESVRGEVLPIFLGAAGGMLLSIPLGAMSAAPQNWLVPLLGIPLGAGVLKLLFPWTMCGGDSPLFWIIPVAVLLIHLMFSGGIGFPGVATGLWLLLALALNAAKCGERVAGTRVGAVAFIGALILLAACFFTGYQPTIVARTDLQRAYAGEGNVRDFAVEAAEADPWATEPRELLADLLHQQWLAQPNTETLAAFDQAVNETLVRAPRAASLRYKFGLAYLECFARSPNQGLVTRAVRMLEAAVSLYPNSPQRRADLAEAYLLEGNHDGYERERAEALRLDSITPHSDKKLNPEQRERLKRNVLETEVRASTPKRREQEGLLSWYTG